MASATCRYGRAATTLEQHHGRHVADHAERRSSPHEDGQAMQIPRGRQRRQDTRAEAGSMGAADDDERPDAEHEQIPVHLASC